MYQDAFGIEEGAALNEPSQKAVTRQFLRGIPPKISSKLQLDYPDESYTNLARQARRIKEVLSRTSSPPEKVASVESNESRLDTLCSGLRELKVLLQGQVNPTLDDVNAVSSKQFTPKLATPLKCFSCGSTSHLQRNCSRAPPPPPPSPFRGRRRQGRFYRRNPRGSTREPIPVSSVEVWDTLPISVLHQI